MTVNKKNEEQCFKKMKFLLNILKKKKENGICAECGAACCNHIALEIDKPSSKKSADNIRWYLLHEGVEVFIDHSKSWFVKFPSKCKKVKNTMCGIYETRPLICREYPEKNQTCEYEGEGEYYIKLFKTEEDFMKYYLKKKKDRKQKK